MYSWHSLFLVKLILFGRMLYDYLKVVHHCIVQTRVDLWVGKTQSFSIIGSQICWFSKITVNNTLKTLFVKGRRIPEPFCLVDMGVSSGDIIEVKIAEGAIIGLDEVRKQVEKEIAEQ